jgi:hypothetical protein
MTTYLVRNARRPMPLLCDLPSCCSGRNCYDLVEMAYHALNSVDQ